MLRLRGCEGMLCLVGAKERFAWSVRAWLLVGAKRNVCVAMERRIVP
jgi:hypothetical protein